MTSRNMKTTADREGFTVKRYLAIALAVAALATVGTVPALAATHHTAAQSARPLQMYAPEGLNQGQPGSPQSEAARDAAIHECNVEASKYNFTSWQSTQSAVYGTCMTEHG
jgi:hypothetical protein